MFDETIIYHKQKLSQLIGTHKRYTTLAEILNNPDINQHFKAYFNAEVNWWIYEEKIRRDINNQFDYKSDKIKLQLEEIDAILYQISRFDRPTIKTTISSAVDLILNYLLRPRTALKWFVFRGEPTKPYNEIIKRLSYFHGYNYLISGFIEYVNENKMLKTEKDLFSVVEFASIIEQIDNDYLFSLLPEDFLALLLPLIAFFNPKSDNIDNTTTVPIETIIIFLDDKGIEPLKNKLETLLLQKDIKEINCDMLNKQIDELLIEVEQNPEAYQTIQNNDIEIESKIDSSDELNPYDSEDELTEFDLHHGYQDMLDLSNELSSISNTINELKKSQEADGNSKKE